MIPEDLKQMFELRAQPFYANHAHVFGIPATEDLLASWIIGERWGACWGMSASGYGALVSGLAHSSHRLGMDAALDAHARESPTCPAMLALLFGAALGKHLLGAPCMQLGAREPSAPLAYAP
jgi:hypothetical protein